MVHIACRLDKATVDAMDKIAIATGITSKRGVPNRSEMLRHYAVDGVESGKALNKALAELGQYKQRTADLEAMVRGARRALIQAPASTEATGTYEAEIETVESEPVPEPEAVVVPEPVQVSVDTAPVEAKAVPVAEAQLEAVVTSSEMPLPVFTDPYAATPVYPEA
jgi:hypothetical protein